MKKTGLLILFVASSIFFAGCGGSAGNMPVNTANANTSSGPVGPPTVESLKALEVKAFEAYKNKDAKFFEGFIDRNFVTYQKGTKVDKAAMIKMIGEHKDEIKGYTFSDEKLTKLGPATAVFTMKAAIDGTRDGVKIPDVISATLFVRQGTDWRAAWHGEVAVADPKAAPAKTGDKKAAAPPSKETDVRPANANAPDAKPAANPETAALMAAEKSVWEAWMARDAKKLEALTASDLAFVNIFGGYFTTRADTLKDWTTDSKCEIKSVSVADGVSVAVTGDTSILFHKGTATGTCGGQKIDGTIHGNSVYVKDGAAWKLAFTMNMPS